jgi:cytochrome c oxidase cbb3-type subunit 4
MNGNEPELWRMDLNLIRSIVTVLAFVVFIAMVLRVWRAANRERYAEAAALPFADEPVSVPKASPSGDRATDLAAKVPPRTRYLAGSNSVPQEVEPGSALHQTGSAAK